MHFFCTSAFSNLNIRVYLFIVNFICMVLNDMLHLYLLICNHTREQCSDIIIVTSFCATKMEDDDFFFFVALNYINLCEFGN